MSFLLVERGAQVGERIILKEFPVSIGRDPNNSVVLKDEEASRFHLRIKQRGHLYILEDLESKNGTYVNGDKVMNSTLQNGDKILVGATEFTFFASEPNIHIVSEMINFDLEVAEDLGLQGPIGIEGTRADKKFRPIRLDPNQLAGNAARYDDAVRTLHDIQGNLIVIDDLHEATQTLLKSLGRLMPSASRAALFIWSVASRQLIPFVAREFKEKQPFLLSQRALEDAVTRIQIIHMPAKANTTGGERHRIVFPVYHNQEVICTIHVEADGSREGISEKEIEVTQSFLNRSAPIIESMLLKRELDTWLVGIIETMIATVEAKDTYTRGHSDRVSRYSMAIADELRLNREIKRSLMISALCHDIGKIGIPDAILKKASRLSAEEYAEMKLHPVIGADIINHIPHAQKIISGVKYHHEKWDGTGYPEGLVGEDIPFFGRIVAVADAFDAMVSGRVYSGFMDQNEAIEKMLQEHELFDPDILKAFVKAHENGRLTLKTSTQNQLLPESIATDPPTKLKKKKK